MYCISPTADERLLARVRDFIIAGGMPEAVREYAETGSLVSVHLVHESIIETYRSDFSGFAALDDLARLRRVFDYVPGAIGEKFKYVNVDSSSRTFQVKAAFDHLALAGVIYQLKHTAASGILIATQSDDAVFKPLFLDIGPMNSSSGINEKKSYSIVKIMVIPPPWVLLPLLGFPRVTRVVMHFFRRIRVRDRFTNIPDS